MANNIALDGIGDTLLLNHLGDGKLGKGRDCRDDILLNHLGDGKQLSR